MNKQPMPKFRIGDNVRVNSLSKRYQVADLYYNGYHQNWRYIGKRTLQDGTSLTGDFSEAELSLWEDEDSPVVDPYAELKQAKAEGKIIQISHNGGKTWSDSTANWKYPPECYRVKPEGKSKPKSRMPKFKLDDVVVIRGYRSPGKIMTIVTGISGKPEYVVNMDGAVARVKEENMEKYQNPNTNQVTCGSGFGTPKGQITVITSGEGVGKSIFSKHYEGLPYDFYRAYKALEESYTKQQEENIMKFETRHYLNDRDVREYSDNELYSLIKRNEDAIEQLEQIKNKPQKLKNEIADRKAQLQKLITFLDAREEDTKESK